MVITDHGSVAHAKIGVDKVNPDIVAARERFEDETLVFQGLEWNIPAAEHGTVFVHPGPNEVAVLKEFENAFDGVVNGTTSTAPTNERRPRGPGLPRRAVCTKRRVEDALSSPTTRRARASTRPTRSAAGASASRRSPSAWRARPATRPPGSRRRSAPGRGRGFYDNSPAADSFPGYPLESYLTYGGFDWMTATVGGLWDSLLAEGKPWWITANSDSHTVCLDDSVRPPGPDSDFTTTATTATRSTAPPAPTSPTATSGPATTAGPTSAPTDFSYAASWTGCGPAGSGSTTARLVGASTSGAKAGSRDPGSRSAAWSALAARQRLELVIEIQTCEHPELGAVRARTGPGRRDPRCRDRPGRPTATRSHAPTPGGPPDLRRHRAHRARQAQLRPRRGGRPVLPATARQRRQAGSGRLHGAGVDPAGPAADVLGDADPWDDLWFYTNPIWVLPG